jgi:hypothetical protein
MTFEPGRGLTEASSPGFCRWGEDLFASCPVRGSTRLSCFRGARLVFESNRPIAHVARDLGVPSETLRKYVRQVEADEGCRPDLPTMAEREETRQLRREVLSCAEPTRS